LDEDEQTAAALLRLSATEGVGSTSGSNGNPRSSLAPSQTRDSSDAIEIIAKAKASGLKIFTVAEDIFVRKA